jgi:hypothetical protein
VAHLILEELVEEDLQLLELQVLVELHFLEEQVLLVGPVVQLLLLDQYQEEVLVEL